MSTLLYVLVIIILVILIISLVLFKKKNKKVYSSYQIPSLIDKEITTLSVDLTNPVLINDVILKSLTNPIFECSTTNLPVEIFLTRVLGYSSSRGLHAQAPDHPVTPKYCQFDFDRWRGLGCDINKVRGNKN